MTRYTTKLKSELSSRSGNTIEDKAYDSICSNYLEVLWRSNKIIPPGTPSLSFNDLRRMDNATAEKFVSANLQVKKEIEEMFCLEAYAAAIMKNVSTTIPQNLAEAVMLVSNLIVLTHEENKKLHNQLRSEHS